MQDPNAYYAAQPPPEGMQMYIGDDGNPYYYYYQPDATTGGTNAVTDDYDSEQNPMSEFYAAAAQGAAAQRAAAESAPLIPPGPAVEAAQEAGVPISAVAETLLRTYEFEDWTPESNGWIVDVITELFFSLGFRIYLSFLMLCAGCVIFFLCISYTFSTLYRLFDPPYVSGAGTMYQSLAYFAVFFVQSFTTVAVFCTWMDMVKGIWGSTRKSTSFWGFSHEAFSKKKPPYFVHLLIMGFSTAFPLAWAAIETIAELRSVLLVASSFFYISVVVVMWYVAFCFGWFFWRALVEKRSAYARRFKSDDLREQRIINRGQVEKHVKGNWYYSESALEEYGLERKTISWSAPVFIIGLVPLFSIVTSVVREARSDLPNNGWVAIGVIFISVLLLLYQMVVSKNHAHRTVFFSMALIILLLVLGLAGCGVSGNGSLFAILFILIIASHGMLLRKRQHALTRKEVCALMQIAIDKEEEEERRENRWDTYMCCCRNALIASIQWLDIKTLFGYRHPKVREFEKKIVIERPALRSDYKVLLLWWLTVFVCYIFVVGIGHTMKRQWGSIASKTNVPYVVPGNSSIPVCRLQINTGNASTSPLSLTDLAMLSAMQYSFGENAAFNFATWFNQYTHLVQEYPQHLVTSFEMLASGNYIPFSVYRDSVTDMRIIVFAQQTIGAQLLQAIDYWGEVLALQVAGVVGPVISEWSLKDRRAFIRGAKFFKAGLDGGFDPLDKVMEYIARLSIPKEKIFLVGDGFNGGYAKIVGDRLGISSVSFSAPGTTLVADSTSISTQAATSVVRAEVSVMGSLMEIIDPQSSVVDNHFSLGCRSETGNSLVQCGDISFVVKELLRICGDAYGRGITV